LNKILKKYKGVLLLFGFMLVQYVAVAQTTPVRNPTVTQDQLDAAAEKDTTTVKLPYRFHKNSNGSLFLNLPVAKEIIYDENIKRYIIQEKIGNTVINTPLFMSTTEYKDYRLKNDIKKYYKEKISALNSDKKGSEDARKDLLPTYYVNSKLFKTIFGGNTIEVNTQGAIDVKLGGLYQNIENPQLSEENRSSFSFDFDQQVTASISAKVGERLKVTANYDTKSTFDFQNMVKVEFMLGLPTGFDSKEADDIVRKIELGNVGMDVSNNLISGAQSLFGVKSQLQFGKTTITSVFSQQKSQTKTVNAEGGATLNEFELQTTQYAANQHFFLAQYFRNNYNNALSQFPLISSDVTITNLEVWITNRNTNTTEVRNIVALTDLGESGTDIYTGASNITNGDVVENFTIQFPDNSSNSLNTVFNDGSGIRNISTVKSALPASMIQGTDFTILENAKKLTSNEYSYHPQLGVLSLNRVLTDGDVLAVSYQYTRNDGSETKAFKVGDLSTDDILSSDNIVVKLLRSELIQVDKPIWNLMMKNVYSLGAYQMSSEGFRLDLLYKDDKTGVAINSLQNSASTGVSDKTILNLTNMDVLDQNNFVKPEGDGFFDYVEGITVKSENGTIFFPTVEPFGRDLKTKLVNSKDSNFLFEELYTSTQTNARNSYQNKDKYLLKGYYKSSGSNGISLGAFNVPKGSVRVSSNGILLTEGVDYVVDYLSGRVQIINPAIEASGAPVQVSLENNTLFNQQTKRYVGVDVEHKFSEKFQMTGTYLNVNERPLTQKASFGQDPINNTMLGLTMNYNSEVPYLTKLVNKLPFQDTDVVSNFSMRADFAYLKPSTPKGVDQDGEATTYIDDFEGSQIPISLMDVNSWKLSSKPNNDLGTFNFGPDNSSGDLDYGKKRAKLAWYTIDQLFYGSSLKPSNIDNDELSRAEVSRVRYNELFPETDLDLTQSSNLRTFDLAYYPEERGSYNYATSTELAANVENHWGGITRSLSTTDFERANVEYIQFWVQDPYADYSINNTESAGATGTISDTDKGGELYFNLGNISEDILQDGRKMFENGLPEVGDDTVLEETVWGKTPKNKSFVYSFNEIDADRKIQDVGLDGLNDTEENAKFGTEIGEVLDDPSSDNYRFFRGSEYDKENATILRRYKDYNNTEGNSPTAGLSTESFPTSATTIPDNEDVNKDQTMNTIDAYYQYKISLNPAELVVGKNNIVDDKTVVRSTPDGATKSIKWYQFRIPVTSGTAVNGIDGFNSIRFMRMFLTKFKKPVVLRFGQLQLVRGDWRRYNKQLCDDLGVVCDDLEPSELDDFTVGVVNIEENSPEYVLPPGIVREQLQGSTSVQLQNEQSLAVKIENLPVGEIRGVYKNTINDLRMYKRLKMFIHAKGVNGELNDGEMTAVVRLGADLTDNFYQVEIPLVATKDTHTSAEEIWPNDLQVDLEELAALKIKRYEAVGSSTTNELYSLPGTNGATYSVKGNPNLSNIKTIMMGAKNIADIGNKSAEIWFNELRVAGFDNQGGWATVLSANANFADIADIALTGRMQTVGFGNVEQRVNERSQEEVKQYGVNTSVNVGKLITPKKWGVKIPMSFSISEEFKSPKYDPQYQDVLFEEAKEINDNSDNAIDYTKQKSISFINVRKERSSELKRLPMPYDIENFSVSYSYNEHFHKDYNTQKYLVQDVRTSATYSYIIKSKPVEPFKNMSVFKNSKYFKLIKDFNFYLLPNSIGVNSNITRNYNEQLQRNLVPGLSTLPTLRQRNFLFDWDYSIGYDLTKSLKLNFRAANKYIYDSFELDDTIADDEVTLFSNFFNMGRPSSYNQKLDASYKIPINKLPYFGFATADYTYSADFEWQAGPLSKEVGSSIPVSKIGNNIRNANTHNISSSFNMTKLYKEVGLKKLFIVKKKSNKKKVKEGDKPKFATPKPKKVVGRSKKKKTTKEKILNATYDLITSVKTIRVGYSENNGTQLPGYSPSIGFLGRDNVSGSLAPTLGFVFGSQVDIRQQALENNWLLTRDIDPDNPNNNGAYFNKSYSNTHYNKLDFNISLKPIKDLDISIIANRIQSRNISQQFDPRRNIKDDTYELGNGLLSETGNFSMSYNMVKTIFDDPDVTFGKFIENINASGAGDYTQENVLPAFVAAYSGESVTAYKPFKDIPLPNWNVTYKGFMKNKWIKKNFSSFTLTHAYKSFYTIGNFTNNAEDPDRILISNITLNDGFSPLIKLDLKLKNSLSFRGEVKKDRTLAMNFNNNTLSDIQGKEYIFGLGYRVKDLKIRTRVGGGRKTLKGDLNMKADISFRHNATIIRTVDTDDSQITGGQDIFSLKVSADYNLSKNLIATFYYDQSASKYAISTSFPRQSINTGISITYNIGN
jgi:cell surface protein SprA